MCSFPACTLTMPFGIQLASPCTVGCRLSLDSIDLSWHGDIIWPMNVAEVVKCQLQAFFPHSLLRLCPSQLKQARACFFGWETLGQSCTEAILGHNSQTTAELWVYGLGFTVTVLSIGLNICKMFTVIKSLQYYKSSH